MNIHIVNALLFAAQHPRGVRLPHCTRHAGSREGAIGSTAFYGTDAGDRVEVPAFYLSWRRRAYLEKRGFITEVWDVYGKGIPAYVITEAGRLAVR